VHIRPRVRSVRWKCCHRGGTRSTRTGGAIQPRCRTLAATAEGPRRRMARRHRPASGGLDGQERTAKGAKPRNGTRSGQSAAPSKNVRLSSPTSYRSRCLKRRPQLVQSAVRAYLPRTGHARIVHIYCTQEEHRATRPLAPPPYPHPVRNKSFDVRHQRSSGLG
jgi:hypothetical protein